MKDKYIVKIIADTKKGRMEKEFELQTIILTGTPYDDEDMVEGFIGGEAAMLQRSLAGAMKGEDSIYSAIKEAIHILRDDLTMEVFGTNQNLN